MSQTRLVHFGVDSEVDLTVLSHAERRGYVAVRMNGTGVRGHARETDRPPGTVGNLIRRAERKLGERR